MPAKFMTLSEACRHIARVEGVDFETACNDTLRGALARAQLVGYAKKFEEYRKIEVVRNKSFVEIDVALVPQFCRDAHFDIKGSPPYQEVDSGTISHLGKPLEGPSFSADRDTTKYYRAWRIYLERADVLRIWPEEVVSATQPPADNASPSQSDLSQVVRPTQPLDENAPGSHSNRSEVVSPAQSSAGRGPPLQGKHLAAALVAHLEEIADREKKQAQLYRQAEKRFGHITERVWRKAWKKLSASKKRGRGDTDKKIRHYDTTP